MRVCALLLALAACAPLPSTPSGPLPPVEAPAAEDSPWRVTCSPAWTDGAISVTSFNASFVTEDPQGATAAAREAILELEGEIQYGSSTPDGGNLTARLPAGSRPAALLERVGARLTSESSSSSDYGAYLRPLCARLETLERLDAAIAARGAAEDPQQVLLERELVERDRQSVAGQIQSYRDQVGHVQVSLSFTRE